MLEPLELLKQKVKAYNAGSIEEGDYFYCVQTVLGRLEPAEVTKVVCDLLLNQS